MTYKTLMIFMFLLAITFCLSEKVTANDIKGEGLRLAAEGQALREKPPTKQAFYTVKNGQSLGNVAEAVSYLGGSYQERLNLLISLNKTSFINKNYNSLMPGTINPATKYTFLIDFVGAHEILAKTHQYSGIS